MTVWADSGVTQTRVAFRMKGAAGPIEGWLVENWGGLDIAVLQDDDVIAGTLAQHVDAVWFLGYWMSIEQFLALQ